MAKNYASLYSSTNDSIALEQRFYLKRELTRGEMVSPQNEDFFFTLGGGSIEYAQPFESSPHRSGRHHTSTIKKKKETSFSFSTYFNIDESLPAAAVGEIDPACRVLYESLLGIEDTTSGLAYTVGIPNVTFTLHEVGDKWARQARGCFVQGANMTFAGDGEATAEWSGNGKDAVFVGIGKSTTDNTGGNTVTLTAGDGEKFKAAVGGLVMLIKADGVTRSADTPAGSSRKIVSVSGDVVTLDGVAFADADGTTNPVYLCYYEPDAPTAINNPVTGLIGSVSIDGVGPICARSFGVNITNDHELVNYCYGSDSLGAPYYVAGNRLTAEVSIETNLNDKLIKLLNSVQSFEAQDITLTLGTATGRRLEIATPRIEFPVPSFAVPETGSIPVTFTGNAYQTALDSEDEITISFK